MLFPLVQAMSQVSVLKDEHGVWQSEHNLNILTAIFGFDIMAS